MHFYQKNIGDFNNATRHLTRVERSLFSDAIELYYDTEKPLTSDINKLNRLLLAHTQEEKDALLVVLAEFFTLTDDGYFNKRCNEEILKYQAYMDSKSKAGKASAEQRAKQKSTGVEQVLNTTSTKQNQEPITINQEPTNTQAGRVCKKIHDIGVQGISPSNPTLLELLKSGATDEEFIYAAQKAKEGGKGFNYVLGIVKNAREEAKRLDLHQGELTKPMKGHGVISDADFKDWLEPKGKLING